MNIDDLTAEENELHYNMRFLCRQLNAINRQLPKNEQLAQTLFLWLGNSIYWWYEGFIEEHSPAFELDFAADKFKEWSKESGYSDLPLVKDFIKKHTKPNDVVDNCGDNEPKISDVIDAYEAWVLGIHMTLNSNKWD